jgi:hypothetical protein
VLDQIDHEPVVPSLAAAGDGSWSGRVRSITHESLTRLSKGRPAIINDFAADLAQTVDRGRAGFFRPIALSPRRCTTTAHKRSLREPAQTILCLLE